MANRRLGLGDGFGGRVQDLVDKALDFGQVELDVQCAGYTSLHGDGVDRDTYVVRPCFMMRRARKVSIPAMPGRMKSIKIR